MQSLAKRDSWKYWRSFALARTLQRSKTGAIQPDLDTYEDIKDDWSFKKATITLTGEEPVSHPSLKQLNDLNSCEHLMHIAQDFPIDSIECFC